MTFRAISLEDPESELSSVSKTDSQFNIKHTMYENILCINEFSPQELRAGLKIKTSKLPSVWVVENVKNFSIILSLHKSLYKE